MESKERTRLIAIVAVAAIVAMIVGGVIGFAVAPRAQSPGGVVGALGISHFSGLGIDMDTSGTATPALQVNQDGSGSRVTSK